MQIIAEYGSNTNKKRYLLKFSIKGIEMNTVSIELALELFQAIENHKTEAETLAGVIYRIWRLDMLNTEKCDVIQSRELMHDAVEQFSFSSIVLIHTFGLPQAVRVEDADLEEIKGWIEDHWQTGTVAICVP